MIWIWGLLATGIPAWLLLRFVRGHALGHGQMVALGILGYVVVPFFAFAAGSYENGPGSKIWASAFEKLFRRSDEALALLGLFSATYLLGSRLRLEIGIQELDRPIRPQVLRIVWLMLAMLWLVYLVQARDLLFSGYLIGYRPDLMGPLATINLAALLIFLNLSQWQHCRSTRWLYGALLVANSIALLSMGGRLYVAAPLVAVGIQHLNSVEGRRPGSRVAGLLLLLGAAGGLTLLGLWRLDSEVDFAAIGTMLLAEPLLTSVSLGTLMDCPLVELVNIPGNFISSLINFVPSALLANKDSLMVELDPAGNCLASPFGATHLGTALLVNFGILGSAVVVTLFAVLMTALRGRRGGWWLYYYLCSLLPFMLFRDGFLIFNKAFFATGLLMALLLLATSPRPASAPTRGPGVAFARTQRRPSP